MQDLQRFVVSCNGGLNLGGVVLPLAKLRERAAEAGLGQRPIKRHLLPRLLFQGFLVSRDGGLKLAVV